MATRKDDAPAATSKSADVRRDTLTALGGTARGELIGRTVTINRPRSQLFAFWRDFSLLPSFMDNVERIDILTPSRSHWVVKAPAGKSVERDAVITEERQDEFIAWTSSEDADVVSSGRIEFRDAGERGTLVTATIAYEPPDGPVGKLVAKIFQREPAIQARRDLRRFKQFMETGKVATSSRTHRQLQEERA
jgi:uncharacterized membrane protein